VRINEEAAAIIRQLFAWYTDPQERPSVYKLAQRLSEQGVPTPRGGKYWGESTLRHILTNPAYMGTAYYNRRHTIPAQQRGPHLQPMGKGTSTRMNPPEEWVPVPVPALITAEEFAQAQARLALNRKMASRNNTRQDYLLRALVSCGYCRLSCAGFSKREGRYRYYVCSAKFKPHFKAQGRGCPMRHNVSVQVLDDRVWQDLCEVIRQPEHITQALQRAQSGQWLSQSMQARQKTLQQTLVQLSRQEERLLEAYLGEVIELAELGAIGLNPFAMYFLRYDFSRG